jgi:hypothetical protein
VNPLGFIDRNYILPREPIDFIGQNQAFENEFAKMLRELGIVK